MHDLPHFLATTTHLIILLKKKNIVVSVSALDLNLKFLSSNCDGVAS
jgi:hypothetical protein